MGPQLKSFHNSSNLGEVLLKLIANDFPVAFLHPLHVFESLIELVFSVKYHYPSALDVVLDVLYDLGHYLNEVGMQFSFINALGAE